MKKLLKLTLAFLFLFAASQIEAQVRFGPEVGLNLSKMSINVTGGSMNINTNNLTSFQAGLDVEFNIVKGFCIQSGVLYSIKGTKFTMAGISAQINPNYIEVPVHLMGKFDIGGPKFLVFAGPYFAYGIGGKIKSEGTSQDINFGNKSSDDFKPFDYGIDVGIGFEMSGVQISGRYGMGLADINTTSDATIKNGVIQISIAYMIGSEK